MDVAAKAQAKWGSFLKTPLSQDIWLILPHQQSNANEDGRLRVRSGILNAASGVFIRVETVHKCPFGERVSPFRHLRLPSVAARDGVAARELAERTLNEHDCCVDELTDRLRKLAPTVDVMLSSTVLSALRHAAIDSQGTTLVTEAKHARRRAYRDMRRQIRDRQHCLLYTSPSPRD